MTNIQCLDLQYKIKANFLPTVFVSNTIKKQPHFLYTLLYAVENTISISCILFTNNLTKCIYTQFGTYRMCTKLVHNIILLTPLSIHFNNNKQSAIFLNQKPYGLICVGARTDAMNFVDALK